MNYLRGDCKREVDAVAGSGAPRRVKPNLWTDLDPFAGASKVVEGGPTTSSCSFLNVLFRSKTKLA
jgi:hypothetical protein